MRKTLFFLFFILLGVCREAVRPVEKLSIAHSGRIAYKLLGHSLADKLFAFIA